MNREQVASGLLALLAVLALGGVAATLDAPVNGGSPGTGEGEGTGGTADPVALGGGFEPVDPPQVDLPDWLLALLGAAVLLGTAYGCYELYREYDARQLLGAVVAGAVVVLGLYLFLSLLGESDNTPGPGFRQGDPIPPSGGGSGGSGGPADAVARSVDPPAALLAVLGLVLLGAVAVIIRASGDHQTDLDAPAPSNDSPEADVAAVAAAAGRAADRIETETDIENAVFRAWHEMTADLPVDDPATTTPSEFADAAVAAGMDRADVTELTRLFEEVRYGDAPVTDERATRATAALRRIERAYGDGEPDDHRTGSEESGDGGSPTEGLR
ncbi:MAG: DUF4129 domain-containing protein [Haloglomus sp.]